MIYKVDEESWGSSKKPNSPICFTVADLLILIHVDGEKNIHFKWNIRKFQNAKKNPNDIIEWKEPMTIQSVRETISERFKGLRQWSPVEIVSLVRDKYVSSIQSVEDDGYECFDARFHVGDCEDLIILTNFTSESDDWWYRGKMQGDLFFKPKQWSPSSIVERDQTIETDCIKLWISIDKGESLLISYSSQYFKMTPEGEFVEEMKKKVKTRRTRVPLQEKLPENEKPETKKLEKKKPEKKKPEKKKPEKKKPEKKKLPEKNMMKYLNDRLVERLNEKMAWDPRNVLQEIRQITEIYDIIPVPKFEKNIAIGNHWDHLNNSDNQVLAMLR